MKNAKYYIINCRGELRTVAKYTAAEIVGEFWNNSQISYIDLQEFDTLKAAKAALKGYKSGVYAAVKCNLSKFIVYNFYHIQKRIYDADGEIIDLIDAGQMPYIAKGIKAK